MYSEKVNALYKEMCDVLDSVETPIMISAGDEFAIDWVSDGQGVVMEDHFCAIDDEGYIRCAGEWTDDEDEWSFICPNEMYFDSLGKVADYILKVQGKQPKNYEDTARKMRDDILSMFDNSEKDLIFRESVMIQFCNDDGDCCTLDAIGVRAGEVVCPEYHRGSIDIKTISPEFLFLNNLADIADAALERELYVKDGEE